MIGDPHARARRAIAAHFAADVTPAEERALREHLPGCGPCRALYDRHLVLAAIDPSGWPAEQRLARGLGLPGSRARRRAPMALALLGGAAAAVAVAVLVVARPAPPVARGGGDAADVARAPELLVYRLARGGAPEPSPSVIHSGDELAFAYRNPRASRRLLVFGVDEHRHVYWYHPGWSDARDNPGAVPIAAGPGLHELPAAVAHRLDGGKLVIHALFTDRALTVADVESAVAAGRALLLPGTTDASSAIEVVP
jgi:hypothetical protein